MYFNGANSPTFATELDLASKFAVSPDFQPNSPRLDVPLRRPGNSKIPLPLFCSAHAHGDKVDLRNGETLEDVFGRGVSR